MVKPSKLDCSEMLFNLAELRGVKHIYNHWPELEFEPLLCMWDYEQSKHDAKDGEDDEALVAEVSQGFFDVCMAEHLAYVIWLYDAGSPLIKAIPDLNTRRLQAADFSGLLDYERQWELAKEGRSPLVTQMASAYIRLQNNPKITAILSLEEFVENQWEIVRQKIPMNILGMDSDKVVRANEIQSKCAEAAFKNSERLVKLRAEFLSEQRELYGEVVVQAESKKKNRLHERAARKTRERQERMVSYSADSSAQPMTDTIYEEIPEVAEEPQGPTEDVPRFGSRTPTPGIPQRNRPQV